MSNGFKRLSAVLCALLGVYVLYLTWDATTVMEVPAWQWSIPFVGPVLLYLLIVWVINGFAARD